MSTTLISDSQSSVAEAPWKRWGGLVVLSLALAIIIIDTTLLNVSLSTLVRELNTTLQRLQWVISSYSLTLAALTVTGGRLGDLFGRKRMFLLGALLFALGSFVASISNEVGTLLLGESIIEGIGAALMMPATSSLVVENFKGHERAIAFGIWGAVAAGASAVGPILGGFLTTNYSWRWGFRINVVVVAILLAGSVLIREEKHEQKKPSLDIIGVMLSSLGLFLVVFGIIESSAYGWLFERKPFLFMGTRVETAGVSIAPLAVMVGLIVLSTFVVWIRGRESRGAAPLISLRLFTNQQFLSGSSTTGVLTLAMTGVMFCLPVFLQSVRRLDALHTGLMLTPMSVALFIVSPLAAQLSKRISPRRLIQAGVFMAAFSLLMIRGVLSVNMPLWHLVPLLFLYGSGMGLVMSQVNNLTLSAVSVRQVGEAAGISNTFRQVGSSLGAAAIGAVLLSTIASDLTGSVDASRVIPAQSKPAVVTTVKAHATELAFGGERLFVNESPAVSKELTALRLESTTVGIRRALLLAAAFAFLAFLVSLQLPETKV